MKFFLLAFLISFSLFADDLNNNLQRLKTLGVEAPCPSCVQPLSHDKASTLLDINNEKLELTVLTQEEADAFVKEFLADTSIPFDYALDGCFARAHKMAKLLEDKGILTGKAFLLGRLFAKTKYGPVSWRYHVAPVVLVKINNEIKPFILDPALFETAAPYEEWKNLVSGVMPNGRRMGPPPMEYFTNRFIYDPTNPREKRIEFYPGDLSDADATLARLLDIKKQLDARNKPN